MWWRCAQYFVITSRCLETIDVCIWHMFVFMSVAVTVWGSVCFVEVVVKIVLAVEYMLRYIVGLCK